MNRSIVLCVGAAALGVSALLAAMPLAQAPAQPKAQALLARDEAASVRPWKRYSGWPDRDMSKFNTLAALASPPPAEARKITEPIIGDAANGQKLVADRTRGGSCLACHVMGPAGNADLPGNVGPDLSEIGNAGRDDEWLFNSVYDERVHNPNTVMPPFGAYGVLNEQEIRDIVTFLKTLKEPAKYRSALDDPYKRPPPVEARDNLDDLQNPGMWAVERAQQLWKTRGPDGFACGTCHGRAEDTFKTWAASMPKWEPRLNKVIGVEEFVFRHGKATTGHAWLMQSEENLAMSVYLHNVANGQEIKVDVASSGAKEAYERGKALTARKLGQLNFACLDCHDPQRGGLKWIRGQWLGEQKGQYDHFPTWRTSLNAIWDIRKRFQWCQVNIRADELPPDAPEYGDLELYLASVNQGLKLSVPGIRH